MSRWVRWLGSLLAIAGSAVFIGFVLRTLDFASLREHLNPRSFAALGVATLLYTLVMPLSAFAWQRILAALGHRERLFPLVAIVSATQVGKYLPGNVGHHVGRIGLSIALGIPLAVLVASMAYEVALLLLAHLFIALASGALSGPGLGVLLRLGDSDSAIVIAVAIAVLGLAALPLLSRLLPWFTGLVVKRRGGSGTPPRPLPMATMFEVLGLYAIAMLLTGGGLAALSHGLFPGEPVDYALLVAAFTLAWAVGFVTPGAPAGLGVREGLLLLLLAHGLGTANATLLILMLRIATTLGDLLCFVAGLSMMPRTRALRSKQAASQAATLDPPAGDGHLR
ncbi:lysylphosphatidylglycerol synthase domain-containing protein [Luteimonas sp. MJ250]|uniref:lysylphosphatidylglycerol synthase domain-containing protein n=1 Tax=Luteimonas sp. MJ250 TaxID=3129236 RepID=UPI0031BA3351